MLSYKYHEWSTGTFDTIKISSYFLLKMNKFSLVTGLNCPEVAIFSLNFHTNTSPRPHPTGEDRKSKLGLEWPKYYYSVITWRMHVGS